MPSNSSPLFTTEPENSLREKLIHSIWLHKDKYCYLFEPDGSYRLLSTDRRGQYTILADGRSVLLAWATDPFTETLLVQEDGSLFMSGSPFIEIGMRCRQAVATPSLAPSVPPQPDVETALPTPSKRYEFEIDTGKMPNYGIITLEGLQVRLICTGYGGNVLSEEPRVFQSRAEAEDYYHSTILKYDPYYSPPFPAETVIDTAPVVHRPWKWVLTEWVDSLPDFIRALLPWMVGLIVLLSPTLLILLGAVARFGLTWRLLLIPAGSLVGFVLMAIVGAYWSNYNFELDDRRTSPPEAGSFAGLGRLIIIFIVMVLLGWIGSGLGAWLVASYWVGGF